MAFPKQLKILFGFLLLLLLLPLLQQYLNVVKSSPLTGVTVADTLHPALGLRSWMDGTFQEGKNNAVRDSIGFRPDFIRLSNQVNYTLFRKTNAHVVIGKNRDLFEQGYIDAYLGKDFAGEQKIRERVKKMKYLQDTLDKLGKKLVFIYAPGKLRYWPEDIPGLQGKNYRSNYASYRHWGDEAGLRQIDFNGWFVSMKGKTRHPIFTRSSIHWTAYGALLAADSFNKFMTKEGYTLPGIRWNDEQQGATGAPRYSEDDLEKLLNLVAPLPKEPLFHPDIAIDKNQVPHRPSAIYIGDSFMWMWINLYIPDNINATYQYWSYSVEVYGPGLKRPLKMSEIDPMKEVLQTDWVIIMYTDCNLTIAGWPFVEKAYTYFNGK